MMDAADARTWRMRRMRRMRRMNTGVKREEGEEVPIIIKEVRGKHGGNDKGGGQRSTGVG